MFYWKLDLATGDLERSPDNLTWTKIEGVVNVRLGFGYDGDTGKTMAVIFAKVQDNTSQGVVLGQSSALGGNLPTLAGYVPTREFASGKNDEITLTVNGVAAITISKATGWPSGGPDWATQFANSPFKEPI